MKANSPQRIQRLNSSYNNNSKLKLKLKHLHRGRYRLTLLELGHGKRTPIAHTTVTVT